MPTRAIKYLYPLILYVLAAFSFLLPGIFTWLPFIHVWILVPIAESLTKPDTSNLFRAEEELVRNDRTYDYLLYFFVLCQFAAIYLFLQVMSHDKGSTWWEILGRIQSLGLLCGIFGINVAHELGHRSKGYERVLAKALLVSSLYLHFYIEHNKGHHKNVATDLDPATSRYNEPVYLFYFRVIPHSYLDAWRISNKEMREKDLPLFHWENQMVQAHFIQAAFLGAMFFFFGGIVTLYFVCAALLGILLLETVNYIEHYGLQRQMTSEGIYERVMPEHTWNSDHIIGRVILFELTRHSDHHYLASRKYQVLRHHKDAPQMPTGYPGSMLMALFPPLWFKVMNKRVDALRKEAGGKTYKERARDREESLKEWTSN